jgi:mannose-1-phosphate guanylyltransferase
MATIKICIMAGGAGTRFWPLSTEDRPKQFIDILHTGRTMLQMTWDRAIDICTPNDIYVLTHEKYRHIISEQLNEIAPSNILCEPARKNTAAAIAFAMTQLAYNEEDFVMVLLSADHVIGNPQRFTDTIKKVCQEAISHKNHLYTLGIIPDKAHTGYGYLELGGEDEEIQKVSCFKEKPDLKTAESYFNSGQYLWNAGIFVWHIQAIRSSFKTYAPEILQVFENIAPGDQIGIKKAFDLVIDESIDYAIMEKSDSIYTIKCDFKWDDLGTYSALYKLSEKDNNNNVVHAQNLVLNDCAHSFIRMPDNMSAIIRGLDGFVVCYDNNQLLIYPLNAEQELKSDLKKLKS